MQMELGASHPWPHLRASQCQRGKPRDGVSHPQAIRTALETNHPKVKVIFCLHKDSPLPCIHLTHSSTSRTPSWLWEFNRRSRFDSTSFPVYQSVVGLCVRAIAAFLSRMGTLPDALQLAVSRPVTFSPESIFPG